MSPMLSAPLLYALPQENNINAAFAHLHSLCLCYVRFSKKTTSMPPSPTYVCSSCAICTFPRRRRQCHHHQHCSSHQGNQLFLTMNQKFLDLLCLHVTRLWLAIENESYFCLVCIPIGLLPKVFIKIWFT